MQCYFDHKQKKLVNSWHSMSLAYSDPYISFMLEWLALNAICHNLYHEKAFIERANIDRKKSKLKKIQERLVPSAAINIESAMVKGTQNKWSLDISMPERLFISVTSNYTEDIIFAEFVDQNKEWYSREPSAHFDKLKSALNKGDGHYVINMSQSHRYNYNAFDDMVKKNIIVPCEKNDLKTVKNVLYQVRCNIFHGEKNPGDPNDDRIVNCALPLLRYLVEYLMRIHELNDKE
jgi:hypothetical protein